MIDKKEFLSEYEKMFGKGPEYYKNIAVLNRCKKAVSPIVDEEKTGQMEETFERMAFKLAEERDLLIEGMRQMVDPCDFCEFGEEQPECDSVDCDCCACGRTDCPCNACRDNSNFTFSPERARRILGRDEGK